MAVSNWSMQCSYDKCDVELVPASIMGNDVGYRLRLDNYWPMAGMLTSSVVYVLLVNVIWPMKKAKWKIDKNGKKTELDASDNYTNFLKSWREYHNISLFLYSGFVCFSTFAFMFSDGQFTNWNKMMCGKVEGTWLRVVSVSFTLSKIYEWIDTMFLVKCGRRPVSIFTPKGFLHLYHHMTTFWLFCFVYNMPGPEKLGMLLNGGVHTLMYNHYWKRWKNVSPAIITILQMAQLAYVIYAWYRCPLDCGEPYSRAPTEDPAGFNTPYLMVPVYLLFFIIFFLQTFVCPKPKKKKN